MTLTVGSLFSGIGGLDLGLERAGMVVKWQVEIDELRRRILEVHWPNVRRYGDVREVGARNLEPVDLVAGGFPCQPHSTAGLKLGSDDERDLWGEFARIIGEIRPRWVLAENVPGLLSSEDGRFFGRVLRDLATLGYDAEWHNLYAAQFGAPHYRERIFIVAYPAGELRQEGEGMGNLIFGQGPVFEENGTERPAIWLQAAPHPDRVGNGVPAWFYNGTVAALGDSVAPPIAEWIGRRIVEVDSEQ